MNSPDRLALLQEASSLLQGMSTDFQKELSAVPARSFGPYHQAAAVLSTYDRDSIQPVGTPVNWESLSDLLADSVPTADAEGRPRWALQPEV